METYQTFLTKQVNLPSPPVIIQKLQSCIAEQDIGNYELAQIIETDQAFTARILRLVNSPFYGFAGKIVSVEEAITMLGLNTVHQLLLTTSLLNNVLVQDKAVNLNEFWLHSFGVGVLAKNLLRKMNKDAQNEAFMGGILHDIGRLIFIKMDPNRFMSFYAESGRVTDLDAEADFFGIDHQKLGVVLAEKWNFPESISTAIAYHHQPDQIDRHVLLASAVHIADVLCHALDIGNSCSPYVHKFSPAAWHKLELGSIELEAIIRRALDEIDDSRHLMGELKS